MSTLQGTQTEKNLVTAYLHESMSRNRHEYFAKEAKKDGYEQMLGIFLETAEQERALAKRFAKHLKGGSLQIAEAFPADPIGKTADNLRASVAHKRRLGTELYPAFAQTARDEGFQAIAILFDAIAVAEKAHADRFAALLSNIDNDRVFKRDNPVIWYCRKCGYIVEGTEPPKSCPACAHPTAYFEEYAQNY